MSDILEIMRARHSVRSYLDISIEKEKADALSAAIDEANKKAGLSMKLVLSEPEAFSGPMAHYGKFSGVKNYVILAGPASEDLEEKCGFWGEEIALLAQSLGLNTCWVALTFSKRKAKAMLKPGEKMPVVLALGYGATQGVARKSKPREKLSNIGDASADWLKRGVEAAMLAPTAMNQQSFFIRADEQRAAVSIENKGGFYSKVDLGIVKHDFQAAAGASNFTWS